jgi:hypothetical protein
MRRSVPSNGHDRASLLLFARKRLFRSFKFIMVPRLVLFRNEAASKALPVIQEVRLSPWHSPACRRSRSTGGGAGGRWRRSAGPPPRTLILALNVRAPPQVR